MSPLLLVAGLAAVTLLGGTSCGQESRQLRVRGVTYSVENGELHELRPGARYHRSVSAVMPDGTGQVHDICKGPAGIVFVAADRGLFTISPEVEHLDRIHLQDGAPEPPFLGLEYVRGYRLYVVTADVLSCLDTRQFFGRQAAEDRARPGPFLGLSKAVNGALKIETSRGERTYLPDAAPPPKLELLTVDGRAFLDGHRLEVEHGRRVMVRWRTGPGARVRYRLFRHHLWRSLDQEEATLPVLEPGDHTVLLAAFDRDLQRSDDVALQLRVRYPPRFDKRLLVPAAALGALAVLLLLLFRARRGGSRSGAYRRATVSAGLIVVLTLQLLVAMIPHGRSWPFVGFSMYTEVYRPGGHTFHTRAFAVRRDGSLRELGSYSAAFSLFEWKRALVPLMFGPDPVREEFLAGLQQKHPDQGFVGFVVRTDKQCLTARGPVPVAPLIMMVHPEGVLGDDR